MRVYASAEMTLTDTNDGISVTGIDRYYMASSSSGGITVDSQGWKPDPQETNPISRYHWSYEVVKYSDGAKIPSKPAVIGVYGKEGQSQWVHIRYSANSNGASMTPSPLSTTKYIGIAVTNSATVPAYTGFNWSKYIGEKGDPGEPGLPGGKGKDGTTTYTWIKYADTPTSGMDNFPDGKKYIGLAFNKTDQDETEDYNDYQWSLMPQNIEIGGRNLLRNSDIFDSSTWYRTTGVSIDEDEFGKYLYTTNYQPSGNLVKGMESNSEITLEPNETYTWSIWVWSDVNFELSGPNSFIHSWIRKDGGTHQSGRGEGEVVQGVVPSNKWVRVCVNFTTLNGDITFTPMLYYGAPSGATIKIKNMQLEKGNVATDWTPAPEDVEAAYTAVAQAKANAERVKAQAYADGKVSVEEKARIKDAEAKLAAAKKYAVDQILADKTIKDTRRDNQTPAWYYTNHPRRTVKEFKLTSTIGVVSSEGTYGILETEIPWEDATGGPVKQTFRVNSKTFKRSGTTTSWSSWVSYDDMAETAKSDAATAKGIADGAATSASNANSLLADIASDSVLTPGEKKNTKKEWDIIVGEKPKIDASADTYNITTQKTAYNNAYNALNTYLTGSSGLLVNLNIKSAIVGNTFRNNFKNYYNARQDLLNKIADGAKSLVDNIEIGGRNYWALAKNPWFSYLKHLGDGVFTNTSTSSALAFMSMHKLGVDVGEEYTLSFEIKVSDNSIQFSNNQMYVNSSITYASHNKPVLIKDKWVKVFSTFNYSAENTTHTHIYFSRNLPSNNSIEFRNFQLEKGNKVTDWTPAPEDVQANIDSKAESGSFNQLVQTVTTESERLDAIDTVVESTKNNFLITHTDEYVNKITTTESTVEGLESRVVSVEETKENVDTFFQFDDAFTIGKSNAQTKLRMTNDEIQFLDGETKGTYITGNTMVSQNMQIQDKLNLPKHTFETEGDITVVKYIG